jgi:flagellar basal-body rod modification protein FlgD
MATNSVTSASASVQALLDAVNTGKSTTSSQASDAENRFLKLLTTQLKNQDPLNPLDNAQMTSQLAQISTVSGIEKLNATLQLLLQDSQDTQTMQAASLVGHAVLVPGNALTLSGGSAAGGVELAGAADAVTVTIKDSNGLAVRTLSLGALAAGVHDFTWDGKTDSGVQAVDGAYRVSIEAKQGTNSVTATALDLGVVRSLIRAGTGYSLDVGSLGTFTMADVKQIL